MNSRFNSILIVAATVSLLAAIAPAHAGERAMAEIHTIVIDPGHGGENNGALGFNGVYEKEITLEVALFMKEQLERNTDAQVILTRESDIEVPLERRIRIANEAQADLFISIHCNSSFSRSPSGIETYVLSDKALDEESSKLSRRVVKPSGLYASASDGAAAAVVKEMLQYAAHRDARGLANAVQRFLIKRTGAVSRGVKELPIVVLRGAEMPGIVVEMGFVSNPVEAERLSTDNYQKKVAFAMVLGIIEFDRVLRNKSAPSKPARAKTIVGSN